MPCLDINRGGLFRAAYIRLDPIAPLLLCAREKTRRNCFFFPFFFHDPIIRKSSNPIRGGDNEGRMQKMIPLHPFVFFVFPPSSFRFDFPCLHPRVAPFFTSFFPSPHTAAFSPPSLVKVGVARDPHLAGTEAEGGWGGVAQRI